MQFVVIYITEPHPTGSPSPYTGQEWTTEASVDTEGCLLTQPTTCEKRVTQAAQMAGQLGITAPILIDEMDNPLWCTYGPAPNIAYLIGTDGRIAAKQGWYEPELMKTAIEKYLAVPAAPSPPQARAVPDPATDYFTYTLPAGASPLRLSLPADIEDIFYSAKTGVGGFGLHDGGHIEGLSHVWVEIKSGTPVRSWADGVVEDVRLSGDVAAGEYHITIDYGQNLIGIHMEIETPYVEQYESVKRGQEIGLGLSFDPGQSSAEFALIDLGRTDGVRWGGHGGQGVNVSPYDYLEDSEKKKLVEAYQKHVIEPYQQRGSADGLTWVFGPYQPYLTNQLFLHDGNEGKLSGEWYCLSSRWEPGYPDDVLTFIEADNPYYQGNIILATDDRDEGGRDDRGTCEVDYEKGRVKIIKHHGPVYYGIFEIDDSEERARLKIEYQEGSYPAEFSANALIYIERDKLTRREDAANLGLIDSG